MKRFILIALLTSVSSFALAQPKLFTLSCSDGKNNAAITFDQQILKDVCNNVSTEYPELSFTLNGEATTWSPAPLYAMCARPIKKTMLQFRKSTDEQIYIEMDHEGKNTTASIRLNERQYSMTCR